MIRRRSLRRGAPRGHRSASRAARPRRRGGSTLLEVLMALALLGLALPAAFGALLVLARLDEALRLRDLRLAWTVRALEDARAAVAAGREPAGCPSPPPGLEGASCRAVRLPGAPGAPPRVEVVSVARDGSGELRLEAAVGNRP